jgi:hypothetical protein
MTDRDYLFAGDLQGRDVTVEIESVEAGELVGSGGKKTRKPVARFRGKNKPLGLCATNCKTIAKLYGDDTDKWIGKRITLYPTTTSLAGETVECIRVRPHVPQQKERPNDGTEK